MISMKLLTTIFITILLCTVATASVVYYPPQADWQNGYAPGTGAITQHSDYTEIKAISSGSQRYYVTANLVDLSTISFIEVNWSGSWSLASIFANVSFGISAQQMTPNLVLSMNHTSSFSQQTEFLDVSNIYGSYYLKFAVNVTGGPVSYVYGYMWNVTAHNYSYSYPMNASTITKSTATLSGYLLNDSDTTCSCGFWLSNVTPVNNTNKLFNFSAGTQSAGLFTTPAILLTPGTYYYTKTWSANGISFNTSSNETHFLTKPPEPTNLIIQSYTSKTITLQWTNATLPASTNHTTYIRYKIGSYPTSLTDGTFGANESTFRTTTISGLAEETTYYFKAWTYINSTGSPFLYQYSDDVATAIGSTVGGTYNITILYENETNGRNYPVNLSQYGPHYIIIHYTNAINTIIFNNGHHTSDVAGYFANNASGNFTIDTNKNIDFVEIKWNDSAGNIFKCSRVLVLLSGQREIIFYIRTNLLVYGESSGYFNNTLVSYTYTFRDPSGIFLGASFSDAYATIYCYNSTGVKQIIHCEYFSANGEVYPMLIYDKKYRIGVGCSSLVIDLIGLAPTSDNAAPENINIPLIFDLSYSFFEVIDLDIEWAPTATGFWVNYTDVLEGTNSVTFTVWNSTGDEVYNETSTQYNKNFLYAAADKNYKYKYRIEVNHTVWTSNQSITATIGIGMTPITDITSLEDLLQTIFGNTPLQNLDPRSPNYGQKVQWSQLLVGVIAGIIMLSFGAYNAYVGTLGCGMWLCFSFGAIDGIPPQFLLVGVFLIVMSIIFALGGAKNR